MGPRVAAMGLIASVELNRVDVLVRGERGDAGEQERNDH